MNRKYKNLEDVYRETLKPGSYLYLLFRKYKNSQNYYKYKKQGYSYETYMRMVMSEIMINFYNKIDLINEIIEKGDEDIEKYLMKAVKILTSSQRSSLNYKSKQAEIIYIDDCYIDDFTDVSYKSIVDMTINDEDEDDIKLNKINEEVQYMIYEETINRIYEDNIFTEIQKEIFNLRFFKMMKVHDILEELKISSNIYYINYRIVEDFIHNECRDVYNDYLKSIE